MRANTLAILKEYFGKDFKIPLPEIEKTNYHKTPEEIVARLYIQGAMNALTNENIDHDSLLQDMKSQDIYKFHEPDDEYFFQTPHEKLKEQDIIDMSWHIENFFVFAWCFKIIEIKPIWKKFRLSSKQDEQLPLCIPCADFIQKNPLRPIEEVLQQLDLLYCLHWLLREDDPVIKRKVSLDIVIERRHVLEWLISDDSWYDVSLDT